MYGPACPFSAGQEIQKHSLSERVLHGQCAPRTLVASSAASLNLKSSIIGIAVAPAERAYGMLARDQSERGSFQCIRAVGALE